VPLKSKMPLLVTGADFFYARAEAVFLRPYQLFSNIIVIGARDDRRPCGVVEGHPALLRSKDILLMKTYSLAAGAVIALFSFAAAAPHADAQAVAQSPKAIRAGTYKIEPHHTQVIFSVSHFGFTNYSGVFSGASGALQLDPADPAASKLTVSIPIQSVMTTSSVLDQELKGEQWFDAAKFPSATFTSTKVTPTGDRTAAIEGNLTLHGVTKPVTLEAHLGGAGVNPLDEAYTVGFDVTGVIHRGDFGVKEALPVVGNDVHLTIAGAFELQQ
jgi:polyisoprenoid-binding protein YceI